jgi:hypothetical protein
MTETLVCDMCGEEIEDEPIRRGNRVYCCEACAFEASRSADCGGRVDSTISQSIVEKE